MRQTEARGAPLTGAWLRVRATLRSPAILLGLLAAQFALVQLLTGIQFGDAARNMHWGLLTWEQPRFLFGAVDTLERIKGFPPEPASLGPRQLWQSPPGSFHPWWGPVAPLLFAVVWGATRSYTLLQLVMPLAGAGTVLCTYWLARPLLGAQRALLAAAFLACYPLFREYSSLSYTEPLSALLLTAAFSAYLRGRTILTVLAGSLAGLCKMDMLAMYVGVIAICGAAAVLRRERSLPIAHHIAALLGPLLLASPWAWTHYLGAGSSAPTRGLSASLFALIAPMMLEQTFVIPWAGGLLTLAVIAAVVLAGVRAHVIGGLPALLLGSWLGLGFLVTLIYCATPGAGNSPRIIIPALPALAVLFAAGFGILSLAWRRRIGFYVIVLFAIINLVTIGYQIVVYGQPLRAAAPAFAALRASEPGFVLTPLYWESILYTRQPATWFEADPVFQKNIMQSRANFARYIESNPIRYVLLPDAPDLAAPEVRAYLAERAQVIDSGTWTLYLLPARRGDS